METIFRPYSQSDSLSSDRSSGDRLRHRQKVRDAIRRNIADVISEQAIIGQSRDKVIKIPVRGIKEYKFIYGDNRSQAAQGDGDSEAGQVVGKGAQKGQSGDGKAGDKPGVDFYETDITLEELVDIMFEDLELPDLERKALRRVLSERKSKPKGYKRVGIPVRLDKRRSARERIRRKVATGHGESPPVPAADDGGGGEDRFRFSPGDLRYKRMRQDVVEQSSAVIFCIMDTSGSMDKIKKYLARSFFFLLYQFVKTHYEAVEVVFISHDSEAKRVSEEDFFHKGSSGGTRISSGYQTALDIIDEWFHPDLWNIYAFHCSDGDNFPEDNDATLAAAKKLCEVSNLFGYGEIKPTRSYWTGSSMLQVFDKLKEDNFSAVKITNKEEVWPAFKTFLRKEKPPEGTVERERVFA